MTNSEVVGILMDSQYYNRGYKQGVSDVLNKIREIVDEWQSDTWTDNLSYECMVKIAELVEPQKSEDNE